MATEVRTERPGLEGPIGFEADGEKVPARVLRSMHQAIVRLSGLLAGRLGLGSGVHGAHSGRLDGQWLRTTTPAAANTTFAVPHGLDRSPVGFVVYDKSAAADIYRAPDHDWTSSELWLRSSVGGVAILLHVV